MSTQTRDYRQTKFPAIDAGIPYNRGWLHLLIYQARANIAIADDLELLGKIPDGEFWSILGFEVQDNLDAASGPMGWKALALKLLYPGHKSPSLTTSGASQAAWSGFNPAEIDPAAGGKDVWSEGWGGETYIKWGTGSRVYRRLCAGIDFGRQLRPPNSQFMLYMYAAEGASGSENYLTWRMEVLRFREAEADHRRRTAFGRQVEQVLSEDVHQIAMGQGW